ncbi:MAG: FAD-linked oxidase C-terminal domain-containing protein [Rhizomicrobium sp.]
MTGERMRLGGKAPGAGGLDLLGVVCGSEGLLGVVVEATVRILPKPPATRTLLAAFSSVPDARTMCRRYHRRGNRAGRDGVHGPPLHRSGGGLFRARLSGVRGCVDRRCRRHRRRGRSRHRADRRHRAGPMGAEVREARDEAERGRLWAGRKAAFPAMGRLAPDMLCMDGTIPRNKLPLVLARMALMSEEYRLGFCNVFHAGDGNLHPLIIFDTMKPGEHDRAEAFGADILKLCVEVGGVLTGEHGVGVEKRDLMPTMFSENDLAQQQRLKCAFDAGGLLNPGKVFPTLSACVEGGHMHVKDGRVPFPNLPRF